MTFRVGDPVVCIDVTGWRSSDYESYNYPRLNETGTVASLYTDIASGLPCIELIEFPNRGHKRPGFYAYRFRPAVSPKQEVSFTQGADPESERWDNRRPVVEPMPVDGWGSAKA